MIQANIDVASQASMMDVQPQRKVQFQALPEVRYYDVDGLTTRKCPAHPSGAKTFSDDEVQARIAKDPEALSRAYHQANGGQSAYFKKLELRDRPREERALRELIDTAQSSPFTLAKAKAYLQLGQHSALGFQDIWKEHKLSRKSCFYEAGSLAQQRLTSTAPFKSEQQRIDLLNVRDVAVQGLAEEVKRTEEFYPKEKNGKGLAQFHKFLASAREAV